ncbi:hypothetical protein A3H80_04715 [Candidatus Roizmanbacteria bacterium RIFCSPLOWO2_02_FULL_37_19]|uniref:Sortase n=1 Tax=Candidatus Roizmanbacteria bacterium RIFCSPHIGHO2_02_FULL_37_24 TaxID=1802037 RepID=A0A1F7GZ30_9BACT|nr:MAG: hypothetical protein A2862_00155 [Candidatus Roizmanbacteria bacterium RIFCSPHIGHO2_01_FULL_38_41]OGK24004.1 MAG: hypothetical protein A3C24_02850 [Candidatus Roizmanbacteria bacterium RIFCSPHIGHO2_02_FULL_37_24]OGK32382.1 MAG: hypothetical protein A3E10_04340 [Candidatus Roizmanbacteria bacterium RIFCSPHIGHO2_12_FULL_37_23]OGK44258.1 MAG: hypothetical protein A2956_00215 [Candidatus Roizmanbacteria bacterium RIFCSPLOWO2_01_FULL_37_57]OGK54161.1 MAG: hypothetical protein A3H80_04715 [Ca
MASTDRDNPKRIQRLSSYLIYFGILLIVIACAIFLFTFFPVIREEIKYQTITTKDGTQKKVIRPVDEEFGIVVPKIGANAKIIANVDPYTEKIYQRALTKGVAHAKGTVTPDKVGNMFLFAHSSGNFYEANRYNSVFYLLTKIEKGDSIYIFYKGEKYTYKVTNKKIVQAEAAQYLLSRGKKKTITLMTCWPPGTTLKRLIVTAEVIPTP